MNWTQVAANPWIGFAGTLLGVVGIALSVVLYFRGRKVKKPAVFTRSIRWFDGEDVPHQELTLSFRGKPISRFTISHLVFWNAGTEMFRSSDFAPTSPLRIRIPGGVEVFDVRISGVTARETGVTVQGPSSLPANGPNEVPITFHYLDPNDGFAVQIIHNGSVDQYPKFIGKLPGVNAFKKIDLSQGTRSERSRQRATAMAFSPVMDRVVFPIFVFSIASLGPLSIYWTFSEGFHWYYVFLYVCTAFIVLPFAYWAEPRIPKDLLEQSHIEIEPNNKTKI